VVAQVTSNELPEWWRSAVRDVQAEYSTAIKDLNKVLDVLYNNETLVRGINPEFWRRASKLIREVHAVDSDLCSLWSDIGAAKPDD
jgi:hypothetical protein